MKQPAISLLYPIIIVLVAEGFHSANAQTKTITGHVNNKTGQPLQVEMTLNTPKQDRTQSNPDGSYTLTTEDYPTSTRDKAQQDNTKIWPNPAQTRANMQLPALEGTLEAYDLNGKLLGKIDLNNTQEMTFNATNTALIRYTNKEIQSTQKLLLKQGNNQVTIQAQSNQEPRTKSGITETFGYNITFTGENIQDTTIAVENFDKSKTEHNQNFTLDELITKIKNIPDSATTKNTITLNLKEYFKNDDETTYNSDEERITFEDDNATINLTKGDVNANITAQEPGRSITSNNFKIKKYHTIKGTLTNIENNKPITNATILAWNGQGELIYTTTNEKGEYELPSNKGINQIKIIKERHQTRTTYEEGKDTTINWNIYNKETFPLQAIKELTGDETKHFKNKPTIYFKKEDKYPQESYDTLEKLIQDVDSMSQGNTHDLEIKYFRDAGEIDLEKPIIIVRFVENQNSTWGYKLTDDQKYMKNASINIHHWGPEYAEWMYYSMAEEFGSAYLGAWLPIRHTPIKSQYHFSGEFNTPTYQHVDSIVTRFHFTRHPNAKASNDNVPNQTGMNELDTKQEIQQILNYEKGTLKKQEYDELPQAIRQEIEQQK
jgi:hypothetical protein